MHEDEKSDLAIVAVKSANNSGQPGAEWVERRAGAEGNVGQQHTRRAQDRASVSQALDRMRKAAKERKKEGSLRYSTMSMSRCCGRRSMP